DDDMYVVMRRKKKKKFIVACKTDLGEEYFLQTPETEPDSADYEIARVRLNGTAVVQSFRKNTTTHSGFYVEIFPYDNLPKNKIKQFFYGNYFRLMKRVCAIRKGYTPSPKSKLIKAFLYCYAFCSRIVPLKVLEKRMINYHVKENKKNTDYVFLLSGAWGYQKEKHLRSKISEFTKVQFEDDIFTAPKDYDSFLREQYDDYMQLPKDIESCYNKHRCIELDFGKYR
ncbi:MAG: LicD family protein, partial [Treponema sp.]|nr:LicD family protein [Treponema sp.]